MQQPFKIWPIPSWSVIKSLSNEGYTFFNYFPQSQMLDMIVLLFYYAKILELIFLTQQLNSVSFENSRFHIIGFDLQHNEAVFGFVSKIGGGGNIG